MWRGAIPLALVGCSFSGHGHEVIDAAGTVRPDSDMTMIDGAVDGLPDVPDAQACYGSGLFQVCLSPLPTNPYNINSNGAHQIDTESATECQLQMLNGKTVCVIAATSFAINDRLTANGDNPLVLVALGSIVVNSGGSIDVSRGRAGADPQICSGTAGNTSNVRGSGGSGGSFALAGGTGGEADGGNGAGGTPGPVVQPPFDQLRGGCNGKSGGDGASSTKGGGGAAGGVVYLLAGGAIILNGPVDASGGGGSKGDRSRGGGGGGGSGGMIVLAAETLTINSGGRIYANGGGGGGGADNNTAGSDGSQSGTTLIPTKGSGGGGAGGDGGNGGYAMVPAETAPQAMDGAGGGGGGVGVIRVLAGGVPPSSNVAVSPPATN